MKRIEQLRSLSKEHHLSLVLASKALKATKSGDKTAVEQLCQQVSDEFDSRWDEHFKKEEQTIFSIIEEKYKNLLAEENVELHIKLRNQHDQMRNMADEMKKGRIDQLAEFGQLLKDHTRLEERVLFPLISALFTAKELDAIAALEHI